MTSRRSSASPRHRAGFTLIELLVVISIIAVLLALSAGVYLRARVVMQESATNATLQKLHSVLDQQWKVVLDKSRESVKDNSNISNVFVNNLAGNDNRRALVIWTKMQLRLEFPQNFYEAVTWPQTVGLQPKSTFMQAINGVVPPTLYTLPPTGSPLTAADVNPASPALDNQYHLQSAALLYLALTQARGGLTAFNPTDHLGAGATGTVNIGGKDFKVFLDTWAQPIAFIRWPYGAEDARDLNSDPAFRVENTFYRNTANQFTSRVDAQDPEMTLTNIFGFSAVANRNLYQQYVHTLTYPNIAQTVPGSPSDRVPPTMTPVIFSIGRDGLSGIRPDYSIGNLADEQDNLYAYRLRGLTRK